MTIRLRIHRHSFDADSDPTLKFDADKIRICILPQFYTWEKIVHTVDMDTDPARIQIWWPLMQIRQNDTDQTESWSTT